jgi:hypothetical protein
MPSLTMRGRYLMREYWSDSDLFLKLTADERELYQGLWMLSDDDGYLPRDVPGISAALYRYSDRAPRERKVSEGLTALRNLGKVQSLRCCLYLPSVARYPRAGRKSTDHHDEHRRHSKRIDANHRSTSKKDKDIQRDLNPSPVVTLPLPDVARAREEALQGKNGTKNGSGALAAEMAARGLEVPA